MGILLLGRRQLFGQVLLGNVKANTLLKEQCGCNRPSVLPVPHGCVGIVSLTPPSEREGPYGSERHFLLLPVSQLQSQSLLWIVLR